MTSLLRLPSLLLALVLLVAAGFLLRNNSVQVRRALHVSNLALPEPPAPDPASPTGYANGVRSLIVPEHNNDSYQWLAQTQAMRAKHEWRLRHVDYDNAPTGRDLRSPSPYRWWLALTGAIEQARSGQPLPQALERAALWADPVLHLLLLLSATLFVAWRFGAVAATVLTVGVAFLFPFASGFAAAQPGELSLALGASLASLLLLAAGLRPTGPAGAPPESRRWFLLAGVAAGGALWVSVGKQVPLLAGVVGGGLLAALLTRRDRTAAILPWNLWALGGAVTVVLGWAIEYFPAHLDLRAWRIETIHPLYAVGWIGAGELLMGVQAGLRGDKRAWTRTAIGRVAVGVLAVAAVPTAIFLKGDPAWLTADSLAFRLTNLPGSPVVENLATWLARGPFNGAMIAALLPVAWVAPAVWLLLRRTTSGADRTALAVVLGPIVVALGFACFQLRWWHYADAALLGLLVLLSAVLAGTALRWGWFALIALALIPGALQLLPSAKFYDPDAVTETEVVSLVERDLAHWLANRVGPEGAIVLAPPSLTTSLYFHGGLRGIGTPYAENKDGFSAAVRLAAASSADEAQALMRKRNVTHVIMPSWDPFLDEYARLGSNQPEHTLVGLLHQWLPPRWLRPIPYTLPQIPGFEGQSVVIFEVVDVQDNVTALSGLAEYFAEMGQFDQAAAVARALEQTYASELGALIAQAQVASALRDGARFSHLITALVPRLGEDEAQGLPWDRRVSLAIVLAEAKRTEPAREQLERCLAEIDEKLMRSLSPVALYRLQLLARKFSLEIAEPSLRELAPRLLPPEMRAAL